MENCLPILREVYQLGDIMFLVLLYTNILLIITIKQYILIKDIKTMSIISLL